LNKFNCPNFDTCSAPLCPLDENSIKNEIWYPDEEVCHKRDAPDWVKKQKAIAKVKAPSDKFFTVVMLRALRQIRRGISGFSPDQTLQEAEAAEKRWIEEHKTKRVIAKQNQKRRRVVAEKKGNLVGVTSTAHQDRGGEK